MLVHGPHRRRAQQDAAVQGDELFTTDVPAMYVAARLSCLFAGMAQTLFSCRQISQAR
jgi:hypothetical protein